MNNSFQYTVQAGDNLYSIAKKFDTTISNIVTINHLDNTLLSPGQILMIPNDSNSSLEHIGSDICKQDLEEIEKQPIYDTYIVKQGDNLYTIAQKFHTTVARLIYINNLKNNLLSLNQELKVPHSTNNTTIYTVKEGDSLYQIASNYNVTPKQIIDLNQLSSTSLTIGQQLEIPTFSRKSTDHYYIYRVKKEDSLYSISQKFNTTVALIKKENNLLDNLLAIDQILVIPK